MILGIIPARGGSKRLPGKNIKNLAGKPMIDYTVQAAKQSKLLDRFVVVTEDDEISTVVRNYCRAEVFPRSQELAQDDSSIYDTIFHVLDEIEAEWVVLLQPTSPLRNAADIDACISLCLASAAPSCISVEVMRPDANGAVYVAYVDWLREHKIFDGPRAIVYQMPSYRSVDVDTLEDFERAEAIINSRFDVPKHRSELKWLTVR